MSYTKQIEVPLTITVPIDANIRDITEYLDNYFWHGGTKPIASWNPLQGNTFDMVNPEYCLIQDDLDKLGKIKRLVEELEVNYDEG